MAATDTARPRPGGRKASGPDRVTVVLLTVASFMAVLALLATELREPPSTKAAGPVVVLRRVYETRVVESVPAGAGVTASGTSVSQSVSSSAPVGGSAAPSTRSS